ncbi:hypothetical protein VCHA37P200_10011 [Vibrio chagasii]|nr:hypothetical protein VCHA35O142_10356 [Vibrio chagasii]CAH7018166.1 hypothetical protein VCHA41O246_180008 [Vibrio chagasii]CAH7035894.1 hypothetical protein VCHA53O468_10012 [Vibrio chagasii]CAH7126510.1 hypothetical protein VCHA55O507_10642 [Vibrio chagasii]CAH7196602.1 hypothetical protein VCHA37P200_10011 [Vibrio chagasii]
MSLMTISQGLAIRDTSKANKLLKGGWLCYNDNNINRTEASAT